MELTNSGVLGQLIHLSYHRLNLGLQPLGHVPCPRRFKILLELLQCFVQLVEFPVTLADDFCNALLEGPNDLQLPLLDSLQSALCRLTSQSLVHNLLSLGV